MLCQLWDALEFIKQTPLPFLISQHLFKGEQVVSFTFDNVHGCCAMNDHPKLAGDKTDAVEKVSAIIPCLNEEEAIGSVVVSVLAQGVDEVMVVDGNSRDATAERAQAAGARVIVEPHRGYGRAMMSGLAQIDPETQIVLFFDGDGSDRSDKIPLVIEPIRKGVADFVLGSRLKGEREPGSLTFSQIVAGYLAGFLIRVVYGVRFTDMSPFRAISRNALEKIHMEDETFGWNLEMQMRVAAAGLRILDVPVGQRCRMGGVSKVSGNLLVSVKVACVLVKTFFRLALSLRREGMVRSGGIF